MKVALYARVSKDKQNAQPQLDELRKWATRQGYTVQMSEVDILSGRDTRRPGLLKVMNAAKARHVQAVAVVKVDRFGRSVAHMAQLIEELWNRGVAFYAIDQGFQLNPKAKGMEAGTSRLILNILAAVADFERDLISERTKAGLAATDKQLGRPMAPCKVCGGERDGPLYAKHQGRRVPVCSPCKDAKGSGKGVPSDQEKTGPKMGGLANGRLITPPAGEVGP